MQKLFVIVAVSVLALYAVPTRSGRAANPIILLRAERLLDPRLFFTAISGQEAGSGGNGPADIVYGRPGQLVALSGFRLNL